MSAFMDMGTTGTAQWYTTSANITSGTTTTNFADWRERVLVSMREACRKIVHEILYPRNWRWFHAFARPIEFVRAPCAERVGASPRRAQERFPLSEARARKRRAWLVSLRGVA